MIGFTDLEWHIADDRWHVFQSMPENATQSLPGDVSETTTGNNEDCLQLRFHHVCPGLLRSVTIYLKEEEEVNTG